MADIINLNKAKKLRAKADKQAKAQENRTRFGLTKGQKSANKTDNNKTQDKLDGLRLFRPENDGNKKED